MSTTNIPTGVAPGSDSAEQGLLVGPGRPYTTVAAALADAVSGDLVIVDSGTYAESFTVPDGVRIKGRELAQETIIQGTITCTGTATLRELEVQAPASSRGIYANLGAGKLLVLVGCVVKGTSGTSPLVECDGSGIVAVTTGLYHNGGSVSAPFILVSGGTFIGAGDIIGNVGSVSDVLKITGGTCVIEGGIGVQSSALYSATDGIEVAGGTIVVNSFTVPDATPLTNGIHISADGVTGTVYGPAVIGSTYDILVDGGLTGTGSTLTVSSPINRSRTSWPSGYRDTATTRGNFVTEQGWASYTDTTHTSGSPQTLTNGTRTQWTNDAGTKLEDYRPGGAPLWSGNKITPNSLGDAYTLRVDFTYQPAGVNAYIDFELDIGSDPFGASSIPIVRRTIAAGKGTAIQYASVGFPIYCLSTFLANGGTIAVTAQGANVDIYDKVITLVRVS